MSWFWKTRSSSHQAPLGPRPMAPPRNRVVPKNETPDTTPGTLNGTAAKAISLLQSSPAGPVDSVLAAVSIALIGFGVVMVYSASAVEATVRYHDGQFFLKRQGAYAAGAIVVMWLTSRLDYRKLRLLSYPILSAIAGMLLLVVVGFGHSAGHAFRWIAVGPVHVQPAEMAKLGIVLWLAYSLSKKADTIKSFSVGFLPHLIVVGLLALLCLKQPDFGSAVVLVFLTFTLLFVAGARLWYIAALALLMAISAGLLVQSSDYRLRRYLAWLDMGGNKDGSAYQVFQSVMSFGSGGTFGLGLGRGLQSLYLPEAHNDFISAIIGEGARVRRRSGRLWRLSHDRVARGQSRVGGIR